jgi:hypothetical protein
LPKTPITEDVDGLREQPVQLRDRLRLRVMLGQVFVDELSERERARGSVHSPQPLERTLERFPCVPLGHEAAALHPPRVAAADAIAIRPKRLPIGAVRLHLQHLTLLHHDDYSSHSTTRASTMRSLSPLLMSTRVAARPAIRRGWRWRRERLD